jgi:tRNA (cytidine/uridine-2'-O-)-methyltransferase
MDFAPTPGGKCIREAAEPVHIALIEPKIPPNTGNIARLCAATDTSLHLIEPLGFTLGDAELKRAGLDYWDAVDYWLHPGWRSFREAIARDRCLYFSARATRPLAEARFRANHVLVFGNETDGMPDRILEKHPEECFTIPMPSGKVRSLNLSTAVGIVLYQALQQLGQAEAAAEAERFAAPADEEAPVGEPAGEPAGKPARQPARRPRRGTR